MKIVIVVAEIASDMYKVHCPSLPGCVALGRSRREAAERMSRAISGYLASFDAAVPADIELQILDNDQNVSETPLIGVSADVKREPLSA